MLTSIKQDSQMKKKFNTLPKEFTNVVQVLEMASTLTSYHIGLVNWKFCNKTLQILSFACINSVQKLVCINQKG